MDPPTPPTTTPPSADPSGAPTHRDLIASAAAQVQRLRSRDGGSATGQPAAPTPSPGALPGYRIVREVHRGGQGVVYQAVQLTTGRHVAIKMLRAGPFAGGAELARFEREVQLLGQLEHPAIVGIIDRGAAAGSHFLVMDYIRGRSLDAYLASAKPTPRATFDLLASICEAVNAAHLRGVIHRDLKPSNIRIDDDGRPHILDFGLARSLWTGDSPGEQGSATITGQFVGSVPWASPEQAEGIAPRIDVRTDVYSLGVILYHALTGRFPYSVEGPVRQVLDRIASAEPARPRAVCAACDDEIETILLRCLDKQPERRYQNAGELARDLRRYLAGEPIDAKRDSTVYLLRKHLRRHRVGVAIAAGFLGLLFAGLVLSLWLWRTSETHRISAEGNLGKATAATIEAAESARQARQEAARAERVIELLVSIFRAGDPKMGGDRHRSMPDLIKAGASKTIARLDADPLAQASLLLAIASIHRSLGDLAEARALASRALDLRRAHQKPDSRGVAEAASIVGEICEDAGDLAAAEEHFRLYHDIVKSRTNPGDWHTAAALQRVLRARRDFVGLEKLVREHIDGARGSAHGDPVVIAMLHNFLGEALDAQGRRHEAIAAVRHALSLLSDPPPAYAEMPWALKNNLAWLLAQSDEFPEARTLAADALALRRSHLPPDHLDIASSLFVLGFTELRAGDKAAARPLLLDAHRIRAAALPPDDERVVEAAALLAECGEARP
ncbi:MAG: serine/threonine protein kinase [Phycisphaerales bacterium]|nr:serine/threonine protein kinase [Phycisphaerales bacterium]